MLIDAVTSSLAGPVGKEKGPKVIRELQKVTFKG